MKRKNNLYQEICKIENIISAFNEVCRNTNNKKKVQNYKQYKSIYISRICNVLNNKTYKVGKYNVFTIYEPKERRIVSQNLQDKVINHLVARYILYPVVMPCLIEQNVASRKNKGTRKGLEYAKIYDTKCKIKYKNYYILKFDISKFFASIDQVILKEKIRRKIKDKDALDIVFKIIDSEEQGLGIGSMTSQCLAIFYLNDLDHFIKEKLKIKYYIRYQDDGLIFHESKEYIKFCFKEIEKFLDKEHLKLNNKSRIYKNTNNFIFLGRNRKGKYAKYRNIKRKIKYRKRLYEDGKIELMGYINTINCYRNLIKKVVTIHSL